MSLHAHYASESTDCDGRMSDAYVITMNDDEQTDQFGDLRFQERVLGHVVSLTGFGGRLSVDVDEDDGTVRLSWSEQTDEGGRSADAYFCTDESCDTLDYSHRDHAAEAMGY